MSRRDPGRLVILGAGPTGLGAAHRLEELGFGDWLLLEAEASPGGLASSVLDEHGFTWDLGGHVQFSHYRYYSELLDELLEGQWLWHEREAWVWLDGRFVPYPFQHNLHRLDPADQRRALDGLETAARHPAGGPAKDFRDWILSTFGAGIAELFLLPYNWKVWGYPPETLACQWVGERVAVPDLDRIRENLRLGRDDVGWGPNDRFRFPERGGSGAIWSALARRLPPARLRFGSRVVAVDPEARRVVLEGGESVAYDQLLTTLPVDRFVGLCRGLPEPVQQAAAGFRHGSTHVVGVGVRGSPPASLEGKCWMYFPEPESPYYRVTVFSHYSPRNAPPGCWSLMAEVSETPHKPVDPARVGAETVEALRRDGLLPGDAELASLWHRRLEYGYPTPFLDRDERLDAIEPALRERRIASRGRFGGWKYEVSNQDHSFMQGVEWADLQLLGLPEITYFDPAQANSGRVHREEWAKAPASRG